MTRPPKPKKVTLNDLSDELVRDGFSKMSTRALIGGLFHCIAYYVAVLKDFPQEVEFQFAFAVLVFCSFVRLFQWKFLRGWLETRGALRRRWMAVLSTNSVAMGSAWGYASYVMVAKYQLAPQTVVVVLYVFGIAAVSTTALSLSLLTNVLFQLAMSGPAVFALATIVPDPRAGTFVFGLLMYFIYSMISVTSINRFQIQMMHDSETIARQKGELETAHRDLKATHDRIEAMHESIDEAFLIFDPKGICQENASQRGREIIGLDPIGLSLSEVLRVPPDKQQNANGWFALLFSGVLDFESTANRGPKTLELNGGKKVLKLAFHPMRGENETVTSVILTATDVSAEAAATREAREASERANMILRINENRAGFRQLMAEFEKVYAHVCQWNGEKIEDLKRGLHTVKGAALLFGVNSMAEKAYAAELAIRAGGAEPSIAMVRAEGEKLEREFKSWRIREMNLFTQLGVFADDAIEISMRKYADLERKFSGSPESSRLFQAIGRELLTNEFGDLIRDFQFHVERTAVKLGKRSELEVRALSEPIYLSPHTYVDVVRSLVHLFNNALDHGIERPEQRERSGKPAKGKVTVNYQAIKIDDRPWISLTIEDDGGGIDFEKLKKSLKSRGVAVDETTPPLVLAMHIFDDGLSTSEEVNQISGQGIGMGAVRAAILKSRGKIRIVRSDASGTCFEIFLPAPKGGFTATLEAKSA